jgi:hypothetical protein
LARIGQTVPTKMCTKAGYQEIFAEFVEGAKPSEAQWYSVKPLYLNQIPGVRFPSNSRSSSSV